MRKWLTVLEEMEEEKKQETVEEAGTGTTALSLVERPIVVDAASHNNGTSIVEETMKKDHSPLSRGMKKKTTTTTNTVGVLDRSRRRNATELGPGVNDLFVIDYNGDSAENADETSETDVADAKGETIVAHEKESTIDYDDQNNTAADVIGVTSILQETAIPQKQNELVDVTAVVDDSDGDDSADKLENFRGKSPGRASLSKAYRCIDDNVDSDDSSHEPPQKRRRLAESLSSSDDDEEGDDKNHHKMDGSDDGKMEVSFHADYTANEIVAPSFGPTGETRKHVLNALQKLSNGLRKQRVISNMEVRRHAKVPIIAMETHLGFEGDVAIGGHIGSDTSLFAVTQVQRYQRCVRFYTRACTLARYMGANSIFHGDAETLFIKTHKYFIVYALVLPRSFCFSRFY